MFCKIKGVFYYVIWVIGIGCVIVDVISKIGCVVFVKLKVMVYVVNFVVWGGCGICGCNGNGDVNIVG